MHNNFKDLGPALVELSHPSVQRTELPSIPVRAFLLHNVFSKEECNIFIQETEKAGYDSLTSEYPAQYRSNDRLLTIAPKDADTLFSRILPHLNAVDSLEQPIGPLGQGIWIASGLNECLRFAKTEKGCNFLAHLDGPWSPDPSRCSIYSLIVYLNDEHSEPHSFVGGETNFVEDDGDHVTKKDRKILCSVKPKQGSALIFKHEVLHEASAVLSGTKYILRTEIVFERATSAIDAYLYRRPSSINSIQEKYFKNFPSWEEREHDEEKKYESYEMFSNALLMQRNSSNNRIDIARSLLPLPFSLYLHIFSYLEVSELVKNLSQVSLAFYKLSRSPDLWQQHLHKAVSRNLSDLPASLIRKLSTPNISINWAELFQFYTLNKFRITTEILEKCIGDSTPQKNPHSHYSIFGQAFEGTPIVVLDPNLNTTKVRIINPKCNPSNTGTREEMTFNQLHDSAEFGESREFWSVFSFGFYGGHGSVFYDFGFQGEVRDDEGLVLSRRNDGLDFGLFPISEKNVAKYEFAFSGKKTGDFIREKTEKKYARSYDQLITRYFLDCLCAVGANPKSSALIFALPESKSFAYHSRVPVPDEIQQESLKEEEYAKKKIVEICRELKCNSILIVPRQQLELYSCKQKSGTILSISDNCNLSFINNGNVVHSTSFLDVSLETFVHDHLKDSILQKHRWIGHDAIDLVTDSKALFIQDPETVVTKEKSYWKKPKKETYKVGDKINIYRRKIESFVSPFVDEIVAHYLSLAPDTDRVTRFNFFQFCLAGQITRFEKFREYFEYCLNKAISSYYMDLLAQDKNSFIKHLPRDILKLVGSYGVISVRTGPISDSSETQFGACYGAEEMRLQDPNFQQKFKSVSAL